MRAAVLFLLLVVKLNVSASAIYPKSLRNITNASSLIVWGNFESITASRSKDIPNFNKRGKFRIVETLKGNSEVQFIDIDFGDEGSCPIPPNISKGKDFLMFLFYKNGRYLITGFSYGAKKLNVEQYGFYKERIVELLEIAKFPSDPASLNYKIKNWALKCFFNPDTRMDAAWELRKDEIQDCLTVQEVSQIAESVLNQDLVNYETDFIIYDLVDKKIPHKLDAFFIQHLSQVKADLVLYVFGDYLRILRHLGNVENNDAIANEFEKIETDDNKMEQAMYLLGQFLKSLNG